MATEPTPALAPRPKRADAQRNYDKLIASAKAVFAEQGTAASLEAIAEHAGVGIGTLYRNFPSRHALLEAVYLDEADRLGEFAATLTDLPPWEALVTFMHHYVEFAATKRQLAEGLFDYVDRDDQVFQSCGTRIIGAGEPLLKRAQEAGDVRPDVEFLEVGRMVGGLSTVQNVDADQIARLVDLALDGLRYNAGAR
jgi:AcrR family transcriptional regulator